MAMTTTVTTVYDSEVLETLLSQATLGNELVQRGLCHTEFLDGAPKLAIPRSRAGNMLQARVEQPTRANAQGSYEIDELYLEPKDAMVLGDFNPRSFEKFWRRYQPRGPLLFHELAPEIQSDLLARIAETVDFEVYDVLVNGDSAGSTGTRLDLFDGLTKRIAANPATIDVPTPVALTGGQSGNIVTKLEQMRSLTRLAIRRSPMLRYLMSPVDHDKYTSHLREQTYKGIEYTEVGPMRYNGIGIEVLSALPENTVILTLVGNSLSSNLWLGFDYSRDAEALQIDKWEKAGERYFIKMLMKADTQVVWGDDVVFYQA
jgi:hypothetical protein